MKNKFFPIKEIIFFLLLLNISVNTQEINTPSSNHNNINREQIKEEVTCSQIGAPEKNVIFIIILFLNVNLI